VGWGGLIDFVEGLIALWGGFSKNALGGVVKL